MKLHYTLAVHDAAAHEFAVGLTIDQPDPTGQLLTLPAWIPGSYMIRDFARNVVAISARDAAGPVALHKTDKQTWRTGPLEGGLHVEYRVYAWDLSVRAACVDQTRAYFNGPALFLRPVGLEAEPCELELYRPVGPTYADWRVSTTLPAQVTDAAGFGLYRAHDYEALLDYPVEIGRQAVFAYAAAAVRHEMAISEGGRYDTTRLQSDLSRICAEHAAMFGELPVQRYLFLVLAVGDGYGGLEHRDSTSLICKREDLPAAEMTKATKGYRRFMGLCSHEYFHLWNVKRIRPAELAAADLSAETYTELLWAFEGITSYYDELALLRSGCLSLAEYLDLLAPTVTRVMRGSGRTRQSIAESSFDAWTRFYKQDENAPNAIVSYYAKGALVAFGLDMTLRSRSKGALSLDDLMRDLWDNFGRTGQGVPERGIETRVTALLGEPLDDFFADFVYGTRELPLAEWFAAIGVDCRLLPAIKPDDDGGYVENFDARATVPTRALGARLVENQGQIQVQQVSLDGAAHAAGVAAGDILLALDGERLSLQRLPDLLGRIEPYEGVSLHLFRRDRLLTLSLQVREAPADTCYLGLLADTSDDVCARRSAWSASSTADRHA